MIRSGDYEDKEDRQRLNLQVVGGDQESIYAGVLFTK